MMARGSIIREARPADMAESFSHDSNIRIDTHRDNRIMQHVISKYGFTYCGIIYLANGDERTLSRARTPESM